MRQIDHGEKHAARRGWLRRFSALLGLCCFLPALAHHSYAAYDLARPASLQGTVAKLEWMNPHVFVWLYVPRKSGGHDLFSFESGSAAMLKRYGWTPQTLRAGEPVTVAYFPLRDGGKGGYFFKATHADGRIETTDPHAPGGTQFKPRSAGAVRP